MRYSKLKSTLKKKIVLALALGFAAIGCMQPAVARADDTIYEPIQPAVSPYTAKNPNNMFGMATDFGIFANSIEVSGHNDSNVACKTLKAIGDQTISPRTMEAPSYLGQLLSNINVEAPNLYIGQGDIRKEGNTYYVDGYSVGGNTQLRDNTDKRYFNRVVQKVPNFINFDSEFMKLSNLADQLTKLTTVNTSYNFTDENNMSITCTGDYNVLYLEASQLTGTTRPLTINGIRGNKILIINVDMSEIKSTYDFQREIKIPAPSNTVGYDAEFDYDASNIIWNFGNFDKTITTHARTCGVFLAPNATLYNRGGNILGSVIANKYMNGAEVHYVPYKFNSSVSVGIESVNGNCCPSKPLGGTSFAVYKLNENNLGVLVEGTEQTVAAYGDKFIATWNINQPGKYYIQETKTVHGYTKTPVKARFDVYVEDGELKIELKQGKEANGYVQKIKDGRFWIRHYSSEVVTIALDCSNLEMLNNASFAIYKSDSNPSSLVCNGLNIQGEYDSEGFYVTNLPETGFYCIQQLNPNDGKTMETKKIAVYMTPVGHYMIVELDNPTGVKVIETLGTNMEIKKYTKTMKQALAAFDGNEEYTQATDTCVIFLNDKTK